MLIVDEGVDSPSQKSDQTIRQLNVNVRNIFPGALHYLSLNKTQYYAISTYLYW